MCEGATRLVLAGPRTGLDIDGTGGSELDLPATRAAQPAGAAASVSVSLDPNGGLFLNDQAVTPEDLARRLADTARANPETEVRLRADRSVPYGRVVEAIGAAQQAGLTRIGFVADPKAR